ncbi:MAG: hypothetical protein WCX81_06040 [Monoglobales bacterium]
MGLFNQNYNKPGKGVRKDEPEKKGAALYWELFARKWRSYLLLNILYAITCIPALLFYFFIVAGLMPGDNLAEEISLATMIAGFMVIFFAGSPFKSGFIYVLRNFVRQQHAWTVGDFLEKTRKNFGQSLIAFFVDLLVSTCFLFAIKFYLTVSVTGVWMSILLGIVIVVMVMYAMMQSFIWCMMVTFELKLWTIYKNSFLLSMATIPVNIISIVIRIAMAAAIFVSTIVAYISLAVFFLSASGLLEQMLAYPTIKKFMLTKTEEEALDNENSLDDIEWDNSTEGQND